MREDLSRVQVQELKGEVKYSSSPHFESDWWDFLPPRRLRGKQFFSAFRGGLEVARVEIAPHVQGFPGYGVPDTFEGFVEIIHLEVSNQMHCESVGTTVVHRLVGLFPGRMFAAFSSGADRFWHGLEWTSRVNVDDAVRPMTLFLSD